MASSSPIRVGLIGVGWGSVVQVPAFRLVPEFEVVEMNRRLGGADTSLNALVGTDADSEWLGQKPKPVRAPRREF